MLWSDPSNSSSAAWESNKMRMCSYYYSRSHAEEFLRENKAKIILRGHEVQAKGYKYQMGTNNRPLTLTVFSAPNYCDAYRNRAAVAIINVSLLSARKAS